MSGSLKYHEFQEAELSFQSGLNILVGENNVGKTPVVHPPLPLSHRIRQHVSRWVFAMLQNVLIKFNPRLGVCMSRRWKSCTAGDRINLAAMLPWWAGLASAIVNH